MSVTLAIIALLAAAVVIPALLCGLADAETPGQRWAMVITALVTLVAVVGCAASELESDADSPPTKPPAQRFTVTERIGPYDIVTDSKTGCRYFQRIYSSSVALTPLMGADGHADCNQLRDHSRGGNVN